MRTMTILCCALSALALSGCGVLVNRIVECRNETPIINIHNFSWVLIATSPQPSTKDQFLNSWGKPDQTIRVSDNSEKWIYQRKLWCGVIPVLLVPVPLVLSVCDGFDSITFRGDLAQRLHTRRIVTRGFMFPTGYPLDPTCRYPVPFAPAFLEDKVPAISGRVVLYALGTPAADYLTVDMDGSYIASLRGSTYYPFLAAPGTRELVIQEARESALTLAILPGQTYYIKLERTGSLGRSSLRVVAPEVAKDEMRESTLLTLP